MSVPQNIDEYMGLMALDENQLVEDNVAPHVIQRVIRLRALYTYWCRFSSKSPKEIVEYDIAFNKVNESQAYDDIHIIKIVMGNLQEASKKFWRWRINQMIEEDRLKAKRDGDHRAVASMQKNLIKNNMTDTLDPPELAFDKIVPQQFIPSSDPSDAGVKVRPRFREFMKKCLKRYDVDVEFADYTEIDDNGKEPE